jgi:hypothetical protein
MCPSATRSSTSSVRRRPIFELGHVCIGPTPPVSRYRVPGFDDKHSRTCRRVLLRSARTCMMIDCLHKYRRLPERNFDRVHVDCNASGKPNQDIGEIAYANMHLRASRTFDLGFVHIRVCRCMHHPCTNVYVRHVSTYAPRCVIYINTSRFWDAIPTRSKLPKQQAGEPRTSRQVSRSSHKRAAVEPQTNRPSRKPATSEPFGPHPPIRTP